MNDHQFTEIVPFLILMRQLFSLVFSPSNSKSVLIDNEAHIFDGIHLNHQKQSMMTLVDEPALKTNSWLESCVFSLSELSRNFRMNTDN